MISQVEYNPLVSRWTRGHVVAENLLNVCTNNYTNIYANPVSYHVIFCSLETKLIDNSAGPPTLFQLQLVERNFTARLGLLDYAKKTSAEVCQAH